MAIDLTNDEIELLFYCLEQQEYEFNTEEERLCASIIDKFTTAQVSNGQ
jgi:hypothetical protein